MSAGVFQVVMHDALRERYERWLAENGLYMQELPGDELPTYSVGFHAPEIDDRITCPECGCLRADHTTCVGENGKVCYRHPCYHYTKGG